MLRKEEVLQVLQKLDEDSKKRRFEQTIELMINLRGLNFSKPAGQVDLKLPLPHATGKAKGDALLFAKSKDFALKAKEKFKKVIMDEEIAKLKKKEINEVLSYDVLLAEGPAMLTVAKVLGQQLAPKGKMPKPVQPDLSDVEKQIGMLKTAVRITNKKGKGIPIIQVVVGKESMEKEQVAENILMIYDKVVESLPSKKQNIKSVMVKKTMGNPVRIEY